MTGRPVSAPALVASYKEGFWAGFRLAWLLAVALMVTLAAAGVI